jgi:hypothetical protein
MSKGKLYELISSPWFTWLAAAAGMLLFFLIKLIPPWIWVTPDEILKTPTPVFISVAGVILLWFSKLLVVDARRLIRRAPRDFLYRNVQYRWHYRMDGTVEGNCIFDVENRLNGNVVSLPVEGLIWYNEITKKTVTFRLIVRESDRPHHFDDDEPIISKSESVLDFVRNRPGFHLDWSPTIIPALEPGERIAYEVEILTPRTERDAFGDTGTTVGFPVTRFTDRVELDAFAPPGYRFVALQPTVTISDVRNAHSPLAVPQDLASPQVSSDGSHVRWEIEAPAAGRRYYFHYRFEPKSGKTPA